MKPRTVLVTGCMGFIGSNLVSRLLKNYTRVIGFDNLSNPSLHPTDRIKKEVGAKYWPAFTFYHVDITDMQTVQTICANMNIDAIVHLAATGSVPRSFENPTLTMKNNVLGFTTIMQVAAMTGIEKVVYASSSSVYGDNTKTVKTEGEEGLALSPYALSKQMNEQFAQIWGRRLKTIGLRFFNVYGPGQRPDSPYSAVIPRFLNDESPKIYGDGKQLRDFTYVKDVCEVIERAIAYQGPSTILNVGAGITTSINELAGRLGIEHRITYVPERPGDIKISLADTKRLEATLDVKPKTTIAEGIEETMAYYKSLEQMNVEAES